ncbi:GNAT family N-acetyltransferase [Parabacteroides chinchillae]|uniref:Acetyltransferase (GNAT) domain-containing protein n=1 Tax=Parabacteroides chinchillae TaxID=871327 RepID=A0A8G2F3F5_9BACT|nr:GNAT family N-acetyltransferase [Parabacteroides chinchillae]SEG09305.1 Acetyltransferase (GNAT) domain-containing protein [Parabacteroides chinchillae]
MAERTQFSDIDFTISLLTDYDDLSSFSCGCEELDLFFHKEVNLCVKYKYVSTYSVKNKKNDILALFTLAHDSVVFQSSEDKDDFIEESCGLINKEYIETFVGQSAFPAINIGHLTVRSDIQGKGIGTFVLNFVIGTFIEYKMSGCQFITVDSLNNPATNKFYCKNGFMNQTNNDYFHSTRRMYLPLRIYQE